MRWLAAVIVIVIVLAGCGETGLARVTFPVHAAGTGERTFEDGGWDVTLERADVGFGPLYFCATSFADVDLCPRAEAEWLGAVELDVLDAEPVLLGDAGALTTTVRSATFDYGRSWLLADEGPRPSDAAPEGRSAILVAHADDGTTQLEVRAVIDVDPGTAGQNAVFGAPVGAHTITGGEALTVRFDPAGWWRSVDFTRVAAMDDDGDGVVALAPGDADHTQLVFAMTNGRLPRFEWDAP